MFISENQWLKNNPQQLLLMEIVLANGIPLKIAFKLFANKKFIRFPIW